MNSYLQLKNISKNFNIDKKIKVLKNLSYDFHKGKVYALMGPSGSGKSTLLNLISLIDKPSLGSVKFSKLILTTKIRMIFLELKILVLFINKIIYFLILQL
jgi:ABC-type lipoprotein export system ATPase subunit